MKKKLFIQAVVISFLLLVLVIALVYWDITIWNKRIDDFNNAPPRRYVDLSQWHNFNHYEDSSIHAGLALFDTIFMKAFYLLVILQSFFLIRRLGMKNAYLISGLFLSSLIGGFSIFAVNSFRESLVMGLNPYLIYVPIFFLVLQLVIWIYLNMFLFKRLAERKSER